MRQSAVIFEANGLKIEGVVAQPDAMAGPLPGVVICHPYALNGADLKGASLNNQLSRQAPCPTKATSPAAAHRQRLPPRYCAAGRPGLAPGSHPERTGRLPRQDGLGGSPRYLIARTP